jgi:hypothetical protein
MLDTFIKNKGITKTIIHDNNHNHVNEINWDADYDGKKAKIKIDLNEDGHKKRINFSLDNDDLANILNIPSIDLPLDKRLKRDFLKYHDEPVIYRVELEKEPIIRDKEFKTIQELFDRSSVPIKNTHISSPLPNEELLIPLTINENIKPRRHTRKLKTYRVYKRQKSKSNRRTSTSKRSRR